MSNLDYYCEDCDEYMTHTEMNTHVETMNKIDEFHSIVSVWATE